MNDPRKSTLEDTNSEINQPDTTTSSRRNKNKAKAKQSSSRSRSVRITWGSVQEACPSRRVDWRWEQARLLFEASINPTRRYDPGVQLANLFQAALRQCHRRGDDLKLAARMPSIHGAWMIQNGDLHERWEVEARLLAGQSDQVIADRLLLEPRAIATFARIFFDVRDRLSSKSYIIHHAIKLYPIPDEPDQGLIWRWMGYTGGSSVLNALLRHNLDLARPASPGDVRDYLVDQVLNIAIGKVFLAALLAPIDQHSAPRFLRIFEKFQANEQQRLKRSRPTSPAALDISPNIAAMMDNLKNLLPARPVAPTESATRDDGSPEL